MLPEVSPLPQSREIVGAVVAALIIAALVIAFCGCGRTAHYEPDDAGCPDTYHHIGPPDGGACVPDMRCVETDAGVYCT